MSRTPRPLGIRLLFALALLAATLGGLVFLLTAIGVGHADVRGLRLAGGWRLAFLAGLGLAVTGAVLGAVGLRRDRRWGVAVLALVGPVFAPFCLALDRLVPAPGAGRPLAFYLLGVGLGPALATVLLARLGRPGRDAAHARATAAGAAPPPGAGAP